MPDRERLEKVLGEFYDRAGDALDLEDLVRKHPDLEEEIRAHFSLLELVDRGFDLERSGKHETARPDRIGDYRIVREIGRGGMGVVYEAEQTSMGRRVALKVLSPSVTSAAQAIQRFEREARAAGKLRHQNIAPVFGMGKDRGLHYYAMELVEGRSLGEVIAELKTEANEAPGKSGPFGTTTQGREHFVRLAEAIAGVAEALHAAHDEGIVHRDVKPTNLLLAPDGTLKLVDFGLARLAGEGASMTVTGQILGTPHYMSPEQAMARQVPIDFRTDIYSLGATLYEALTLSTPFTGDSLPAVCSAILHKEPSAPRKANPRIPQDLETIVQKAMEKDRERRYATAEEMAKDLRRFAVGMPIRARRTGPVARTLRKVKRNKIRTGLVAAVVLLAAASAYLAQRSASESARLREAEYDRLIARAEDAMASEAATRDLSEIAPAMATTETAAAILTRAIDLVPDWAEGYWLRALARGRTIPERLEDVGRAEERGLARGTSHMLRAFLLRLAGRVHEAAEEERLAAIHKDPSPLGLYAEAQVRASEHRRPEAIERATRALDHSEVGTTVRTSALRLRANLRLETGDWHGAHDDFAALKTLGDGGFHTSIRIASLWGRLGRPDVGERQFSEMMREVSEEDDPGTWRRFAWCCARANQMDWFHLAVEQALAHHGDDRGVQQAHVYSLLRRGELEDALEVANRLVELDPACQVSQGILAAVFLQMKKFPESLDPIEKALAIQPRNGRTWLLRGSALEGIGKHEEALEAFHTAIRLGQSDAEAYTRLGNLLLDHLDLPADALRAFERACESTPRYAYAWHGKGRALEGLGKFEDALSAFTETARLGPTLAFAYRALGRVHKEYLRNPVEGLRWFKKYCELAPKDAAAWRGKGSALEALGRIPEAVSAYEKALQFAPNEFQKLRTKARLHFMQGQFEAAFELANLALKIDPDHTEMLMMRGTILADTKQDYAGALEAFDRAIEINRWNSRYHFCRGIALYALGEHRKAIGALTRCLDLNPQRLHVYFERAKCYFALGEAEAASAELTKLRDQQPRSLEVLGAIVSLFRFAGKTEEARNAAKDHAKCDPRTAPPAMLAWLCAVAGDWERAREVVRGIGQVSSPLDLYNLACVYALVGDSDQALATLEKSVGAGYRYPPGTPDDPDFASLEQDPRYRALQKRLRQGR